MTTQTQTDNQRVRADRNASAETVVGFAVIGCLIAGAVGIAKAMDMDSGWDVLLCLLGSVAGFGMVFYIYFRKS
jgi:hypothetical protein